MAPLPKSLLITGDGCTLARLASAVPIALAVGILRTEWVAVNAVCLAGIPRRRPIPAQGVGWPVDPFAVPRVDTACDPAEVVVGETIVDGAAQQFPGDVVRSPHMALIPEVPIAFRMLGPQPEPARAEIRSAFRNGPVLVDLGPEPFFQRSLRHVGTSRGVGRPRAVHIRAGALNTFSQVNATVSAASTAEGACSREPAEGWRWRSPSRPRHWRPAGPPPPTTAAPSTAHAAPARSRSAGWHS